MAQVYKIKDGIYGYLIEVKGFKVKQEHKPAYSGLQSMTQEEAEKLAELIEEKMKQNLSPTVTIEQMESLWNGTKTYQQIIDEEKAYIETHPSEPPKKPF